LEPKTVLLDVTETLAVWTNTIAQMVEKWDGVVQMQKGMNVVRMMLLKCNVATINNTRMNSNILAAFVIQLLAELPKKYFMQFL
jgi:hypothetical protein